MTQGGFARSCLFLSFDHLAHSTDVRDSQKHGPRQRQLSPRQDYKAGKFTLQVTVPPNTTATVCLPGSMRLQKVADGQHRFQVRWA